MRLEVLSQEPSQKSKPFEFLFIHGLGHAAWYWHENFMPFFAEQGVKSYALSLRNHGESYHEGDLNWHPLQDYLDDILEVLAELDKKPILIGHSAGGALIQKLFGSANIPGAVLVAPVPAGGLFRSALRYAARHPVPFIHTLLSRNLRPLIGTIELYREVMYSNKMSAVTIEKYFARAQEESFRFFLEMLPPITSPRGGESIPMLVIGSSEDHFFTVEEFNKTARKYEADFEIIEGIGHMMMLDAGWERVAQNILAWADHNFGGR